jgi:regulatory protein
MSYKISGLKIQKRNSQRVNVYLDGEFAFGLSRILAAWLQIGQELDDQRIEELKLADSQETTYERAIRYIAFRPRSKEEIRQYLLKQDYDEAVITDTLMRLERSGLVNDKNFAQNWVENRSEFRPRSRKALAYELRHHGISQELVDEAIDQVDDSELAYQAACKQSRKYSAMEWLEFRQKLLGFLARRGFSYQDSATAARRAWKELHSPHDNPQTEEVFQ